MSNQEGFLEVDEVERARIMQVLRDAIYDYGDIEHLARWTGRSTPCIYAIRSGRTKWPHAKTIMPLARHLGLQFTLTKRK